MIFVAELKLICESGHEFYITLDDVQRNINDKPYVVCKHMYPYERFYIGDEFYAIQAHQCTSYVALSEEQVRMLSESSE